MTQEDTYTVQFCIPDLDIETELELTVAYVRQEEQPESTIEPYEPGIPAETFITSAEVQGYDVSFLLDLEDLAEKLHWEEM